MQQPNTCARDRRRSQWARSKQKQKAQEQELLLQMDQLREEVAQLKRQKEQLRMKNSLLNEFVEIRDLGILRLPRVEQDSSRQSVCPICSVFSGERNASSIVRGSRKWLDLGYSVENSNTSSSKGSIPTPTSVPVSGGSTIDPAMESTVEVLMELLDHPIPLHSVIRDGLFDYSKAYELLLAVLAGQVARVEHADDAHRGQEGVQLKKIVMQAFHLLMFHSQWKNNFKWYQGVMRHIDDDAGEAIMKQLRAILTASNLSDDQVQAIWLARSHTMQRLQQVYRERETVRDLIDGTVRQEFPTSCFDIDLESRAKGLEALEHSSSAELLLILELEWMMYTQILQPLVVAKLMIHSFPSFPDTFLVANLVAQEAATRGFIAVEEMAAEQAQWAAVFPKEREHLPQGRMRC